MGGGAGSGGTEGSGLLNPGFAGKDKGTERLNIMSMVTWAVSGRAMTSQWSGSTRHLTRYHTTKLLWNPAPSSTFLKSHQPPQPHSGSKILTASAPFQPFQPTLHPHHHPAPQ